jgi:chromatin remodeling complex protein RSC6
MPGLWIPSVQLAAIVGAEPLRFSEAVMKVLGYITAHRLEDPSDAQRVIPIGPLAEVAGHDPLDLAELGRRIKGHLRPSAIATDDGEEQKPPELPAEATEKVTPSSQLAAIVGPDPLTRPEIVRRVWAYIKTHQLQDRENPQRLHPDALLAEVTGPGPIKLYELPRRVSEHMLP